MKKIATVALALAFASTAVMAETAGTPVLGADVTALAPTGTAGAVAGQTVVIAGVGTATWVVVGSALVLVLTSLASDSST